MKEQKLIDQMVRQMVVNLTNLYCPVYYEPLDPEWENKVIAGDGYYCPEQVEKDDE